MGNKKTKQPRAVRQPNDYAERILAMSERNVSKETREGEEIGYKTGWYKKPTDYTNR